MSRPWFDRLLSAVTITRVTLVDDSKPTQQVQVSESLPGPSGSTYISDQVARLGQFGFTSSPPPQSDALVLRLFGNRTLSIAIATGHQTSRLKNLQAGDSALYDVRGAKLYLGPQGPVLDAAGGAITVQNFSTCTVKGDLHVTGDVIAQSATDPISLTSHLHPLHGPGALETGAPLPE